ncbi:penicillin-binding transpeptidase domain-containing protein [Anaerotruncus colihominis]|uniref:penicillin-binding transpeptidase domain-containing protein n=1 Tax=Anaerotruncus colihominis TaxID=169435 RepID=UPI00189D82F9|nr:penicillin-binding transpeptidase domain-containing protein [Anaerotruncus colihominis]
MRRGNTPLCFLLSSHFGPDSTVNAAFRIGVHAADGATFAKERYKRMAKSPTYHMKSRMVVVLVAMIVLGFCVVLHQLFVLQIVEGESMQARALQHQLRTTRIGAKRGVIYDTNGEKLAVSADVSSVCIAPKLADTPEKEEAVIDLLAEYIGADKETVKKKLERKGSYYEVVKEKVEDDQADALMAAVGENGLTGVIFLEEDTRRYYPYGNFASAVLGFANNDNHGAYGLEAYYEKTLAGTPGRVVSMKNGAGVDMDMQYVQRYEAQDGNSLVLTIDETIQHYLEKNLEIALSEHRVRNRVTGIVMDPKTGAVLAMASKPDFDPNNPYDIIDENVAKKLEDELAALPQDDSEESQKARQQARMETLYSLWRNYAISDPYEPGSVFKIVTAAGALECGAVTTQSGFNCLGYVTVNGTQYHCWYWTGHHSGHGAQDLTHAVMNSCNPAFIDIGQRMGAQNFAENFANFGLTQPTGIDMPGEAGSIYHGTYSVNDLASSSFGQTFKVTPIQMITAACAAINGGQLMQPYVVKQIIDSEGNVISNTEPVVKRQVVSKEVSEEMALILEQVVGGGGSGKQAAIPGYRVGGKTGTSEQLDDRKEDGRIPNTLSFFGFAPVDDPQVACLVLLDDPDIYNAFGSTVAAPIVGSILAETLPYMGIEPQYTEEELENIATQAPYLLNYDLHEAEYEVRRRGLKFRVIGNGAKVLKQVPGAGELIPQDGVIVLYTEEEGAGELIPVPDVVGKTLQEANQSIVGSGLQISVQGEQIEGTHSVVSAQSPDAGEMVEAGTVVTVECVAAEPPAQP